MRKFIIVILFFASLTAQAQELNARVTVVATRVNTSVNRTVFQTLQNQLNSFLNGRKWTNDNISVKEKIDCNFLLNIESTEEPNVYSGQLSIQAARPIFNTSYLSPIINYKDDNVLFKYIEFQQLEFNENRISGTDAQASNLTALFAYWADVIIAFDYLSFAPHGGDPYFLKAQNVVNNAPDGRGVTGWKAFDGVRNRYWLVENMLNSRYDVMHDVYYGYYRLGMDKFYEDENAARTQLLNVLNLLNNYNNDNPNTMINQFFFQGKANELLQVFSKALPQDKARALDILPRLDITNADKYRTALK